MHLELVRRLVTAVTLGVTSGRRDYLKRTPIAAVVLWVMPRGGVTNHIGVERESSSFIGHTLYSASPHYPFPVPPPLSPFLSFPISSSLPFFAPSISLSFLQNHSLPESFIRVTHPEDEPFLPLSCAMATNNRKKQECLRLKICRGFRYPTPLLHYYSAGNGWLLPNAEAEVCLSASMLTPMCFLGQ